MLQTLWQRFGKACSSMTVVLCTKRGPWFDDLGIEELDWPAQSPDLIPTELSWNVDCKPGLLIQYQCLTSQVLFRLNGYKFLQTHSKIVCKAFSEECSKLNVHTVQ